MANTFISDTKYQGFRTETEDFTLQPSDHLQWIRVNTDTEDIDITIPDSNPSNFFYPGWNCTIENTGTGFINLISGVGVTLEAPATTIEDVNRSAQLIHTSTPNLWVAQGYLGANDLTSLTGVTVNAPDPDDYNVLAYEDQTSQWRPLVVPRFFSRGTIVSDYTLVDTDHKNLLIFDTTGGPIDLIQNNSTLTPGFDVEVINIGTGILHFTGAGNITSQSGSGTANALIGAWSRGRIYHQSIENYFLIGDWFAIGD